MNSRFGIFPLFVLFLFWAVSNLSAQEYFQSPMTPIYGKPHTNESLAGKVVYIEYWGIHCGPCRAAFPHLIECQAMFAKTGCFEMIGSHVQEMSPEVTEFLQSKNCNFTNYQQYSCPLAPPAGGGIPQAYLLDAQGNLAASGHPSEVMKQVAPLVQKAMQRNRLVNGFSPVLDLEIPMKYQRTAQQFAPGKSWKAPMAQLKKKAEKDEDAKALFDGIETAIEVELESLREQYREKPSETFYHLNRMSKSLKDLPQEKQANSLEKKLKKAKGIDEMQKIWTQITNFQKKSRTGNLSPKAAVKEMKNICKKLKGISENEEFHKAVRREAETLAGTIQEQLDGIGA